MTTTVHPTAEELGDLGLGDLDLAALAADHSIVGATVAVSIRGRRHERSVGVTRIGAGAAVGSDTRFLIGSVAKAYVATVVMTMVHEGALELDAPASTWLRGHLDEAITIRHLLAHTAGLPDAWATAEDDDRDDAVAALAARQSQVGLHARPGERFGYSNAGYVVLGRLIEVVDGRPFDQVVHDRLLAGSTATFDLATVATGSFAVGHLGTGGDTRIVDRVCARRAMGPAGGRLWATAGDVLSFGELHLDSGGPAATGGSVPSAVSVAMREPQIAIPDHRHGSRMGLGVVVDDRWGTDVVLHDGGAVGQSAYLRIVPEHDIVLSLVCTGGVPQRFHRLVFDELASRVPGVRQPADVVADPLRPVDVERYIGCYRSPLFEVVIDRRGADGLSMAIPEPQDDGAPARRPLAPVDDEMFVAEIDGRDYGIVFGFDPTGRADRVLAGLRLLPRIRSDREARP